MSLSDIRVEERAPNVGEHSWWSKRHRQHIFRSSGVHLLSPRHNTVVLLMLTKDAKSTCGWQIFLRDGICRVSRHKMLCNMTSRRVLARCSSLPSLFVLSTNEHCLQATSRTFALELYQKGDGKIDAVALQPSLWRPRAL